MSGELKSCPFCGGEAALYDTKQIGPDRFMIYCTKCIVRMNASNIPTVKAYWNKRTPEVTP